ncbi:DUF971 domain-containing protein [Viridibacterium curvum]|uniref:DUF971 domain-containing protein n=1 Tax=Viridibacterium curvum TaxID=1101404 RepID=A0ABP9QMF6_9RHOO
MSDSAPQSSPIPTELRLHQKSQELEIHFEDGVAARLSSEFLRVHSPSAEVKGHGPGQETLQTGKRNVAITTVEPVGHYAVRLVFSDGHNSGLYSWDLLYRYAQEHEVLWADYLQKLEAAGASRDHATPRPASGGCSRH